jgi:hypothetical protein
MTRFNCFQRRKPPAENPEDEFKTGDPEETEALHQQEQQQQQQQDQQQENPAASKSKQKENEE